MHRRALVGGGLIGMTALLGGGVDADAAQERPDIDTARAVDRLRALFETALEEPFAELAEIRRQPRLHLKASHKFPDFIEIGINVWERLVDWHVRQGLTLDLARRDDGRYTMTFMFTTLVLRPDQADSFVGFGYDAR